jgi:pimeloyl-ACP methyl ester carboxylesterase
VLLPHDDVGAGSAVVLLHAGIADRTMWAEHLRPIADAGCRVVAMDLPGFGEAPPAREDDAWSDVLETMDAPRRRTSCRPGPRARCPAAGAVTEAQDPVEADPAALGRLAIPALVAAGELDMPDFRAGAEALAQRLANARRVVIARAGHLAPLEQPEAFRELLVGFLRESAAREAQRGS